MISANFITVIKFLLKKGYTIEEYDWMTFLMDPQKEKVATITKEQMEALKKSVMFFEVRDTNCICYSV